ncbi:hypothetical protein BDN70DRAFT_888883 [Pholiota conissans]|uniref:Uncharacterized protein n=1 Tax=Pholiota conissans TaxID=109636 RepID=A0A9P5YIT1_9AGAR|nr:hypothetical protein BDN70DRAFT_888883 [Pholiota conissans]
MVPLDIAVTRSMVHETLRCLELLLPIVVHLILLPYSTRPLSHPCHFFSPSGSSHPFISRKPRISTNSTPRPDIPVKHVVLTPVVHMHMRDVRPIDSPIINIIRLKATPRYLDIFSCRLCLPSSMSVLGAAGLRRRHPPCKVLPSLQVV